MERRADLRETLMEHRRVRPRSSAAVALKSARIRPVHLRILRRVGVITARLPSDAELGLRHSLGKIFDTVRCRTGVTADPARPDITGALTEFVARSSSGVVPARRHFAFTDRRIEECRARQRTRRPVSGVASR